MKNDPVITTSSGAGFDFCVASGFFCTKFNAVARSGAEKISGCWRLVELDPSRISWVRLWSFSTGVKRGLDWNWVSTSRWALGMISSSISRYFLSLEHAKTIEIWWLGKYASRESSNAVMEASLCLQILCGTMLGFYSFSQHLLLLTPSIVRSCRRWNHTTILIMVIISNYWTY